MKVQVISFNHNRSHAEIVVNGDGKSTTRHVRRETDGQYHWRLKDPDGQVLAHETFSL